MTEQITIKLNKKTFRPLLEKLRLFAGHGLTESDSDIAGKALFYAYRATYKTHSDIDKTTFDIVTEKRGLSKPEALLDFLNDYHKFKKEGLAETEKKNQLNKKKNHNHKR